MAISTYPDVQESMRKNRDRPFSLLLGNGFSMSYAPDIFSYNALHGFVSRIDDSLLNALFRVVDTHDFERVMHQLDTFAALCEALDLEPDLKTRIETAAEALKKSLIDAIRALHPEHVYTIPQAKCDACTEFLCSASELSGQSAHG